MDQVQRAHQKYNRAERGRANSESEGQTLRARQYAARETNGARDERAERGGSQNRQRRTSNDRDQEYHKSGYSHSRVRVCNLQWSGPQKRDQPRRDNEPGNGKEVRLTRRRFSKEFKLAAVRRDRKSVLLSGYARFLRIF